MIIISLEFSQGYVETQYIASLRRFFCLKNKVCRNTDKTRFLKIRLKDTPHT
jgi:hypothetical protein